MIRAVHLCPERLTNEEGVQNKRSFKKDGKNEVSDDTFALR